MSGIKYSLEGISFSPIFFFSLSLYIYIYTRKSSRILMERQAIKNWIVNFGRIALPIEDDVLNQMVSVYRFDCRTLWGVTSGPVRDGPFDSMPQLDGRHSRPVIPWWVEVYRLSRPNTPFICISWPNATVDKPTLVAPNDSYHSTTRVASILYR